MTPIEIVWMVVILTAGFGGAFTMGYFFGKMVWQHKIHGDFDSLVHLRKQLDEYLTKYHQDNLEENK